MKKFKYILVSSALFSLLIFQGCQNCDEAVKTAQQGFDSRLTAVSDSIKGAWTADIEAIRADYEARISSLDSLLAAKAQTQGKAPAKKPAAPAPTKKEDPKTMKEKAQQEAGEKPKSMKEKAQEEGEKPKSMKEKAQEPK